MKVKIWGSRGLKPAPIDSEAIQSKVKKILNLAKPGNISSPEAVDSFMQNISLPLKGTYGGNTPCLEIRTDSDDLIIINAGSGLAGLSSDLMGTNFAEGRGMANFIFTSSEWSHIQGLPFFEPLYVDSNRFNIYSPLVDLELRLKQQQSYQYTTKAFNKIKATLNFFTVPEEGEFFLNDLKILTKKMPHPYLPSFGVRLEKDNKSLVYTSSSSFDHEDFSLLNEFQLFFKEADILIFDTLNGFEKISDDFIEGHSTAKTAVEIANIFQVKKLIFFNHHPKANDNQLENLLYKAQAYQNIKKNLNEDQVNLDLAFEGMVLNF
jgi:phosphoribosyl 1,2-cyclic phosphodiesterase